MCVNKGIHTFSLSHKSSYAEIQNLSRNKLCYQQSHDKYYLNSTYVITEFKKIGVEIQYHQSLVHTSWIKLIVNPSSLLAGAYCPTGLFTDSDFLPEMKKRLRKILDACGIEYRLKTFKVCRVDLTQDHYYESCDEVMMRLHIFKKSFYKSHYKEIPFKTYDENARSLKLANEHSWTIACGSCAFSVYDKTYELEKRHGVSVEEHILRTELRLERGRIRKLTKCTSWTEQLAELLSKQEEIVDKFLHRIYQDFKEIVPLDELICRIEDSGFQKKTKERMILLAKKISDCESITVAQKRLKMKKNDVIKLLKKFRQIGLNPICQQE